MWMLWSYALTRHMRLFSNKPQSFLGVDIGAGGVKVVELRNDRHRARLSTYGFADAPVVAVRPATSLGGDLDGIARMLREVCERARVESRRAVTSLPVAAVFSSVLSLPRMQKKELAPAVEWEAKKLLPLPIEEMITDWKLLTPAEDLEVTNNETATVRVLLTAAPRTLVQEYLTVFRSAELELLSLETEAFALIRSLIGDDPSVMLVADLGAARTSMVIAEGGTPVLSRSVDVGGRHLTEAIAAATGGDLERAEHLKLDLAVTAAGNAAAAALPALLARTFEPVVQEIRYAVNLYQSQATSAGRTVEKVILAGGCALLPGFAEYLALQLNLRVFVGDPWARAIYPVDLRPALDTIGPRFAVAVGLAMREVL